MEKLILQKKNGQQIACVKEIPASPKGIAIVLHGFASSKESSTVTMLLRRFPAAGIGVFAIDQPAHGEEASAKEELRIGACIDSLATAEEYVVTNYPETEIFYFGSSFGAYITGLYISSRPHKGRKVFFRSAAVNMPSLFIKENPTKEEQQLLDDLEEKGYMQPSLDMGSPIRVTKAMMSDLAETDLFLLFDPNRFGENKVMMAHGAEDEVIDPAAAARFADRFNIPIRFFAGEGHSISNDETSPDHIADLAIEWFLSDNN